MLIHCRRFNFDSESQIHCRTHTFGNEHRFVADNSVSVANHKFTADNTFSMANADSLQPTHFQQWMLIRCRQFNFDSEHWFAADNSVSVVNHKFNADNTLSAANADSLQTTRFRQRMLSHCRQRNFGREHWFAADHMIRQRKLIRCRQHHSAAYIPSLQITQIGSETNSLQTTQFGSEINSPHKT
jgi:hypothetical protein